MGDPLPGSSTGYLYLYLFSGFMFCLGVSFSRCRREEAAASFRLRRRFSVRCLPSAKGSDLYSDGTSPGIELAESAHHERQLYSRLECLEDLEPISDIRDDGQRTRLFSERGRTAIAHQENFAHRAHRRRRWFGQKRTELSILESRSTLPTARDLLDCNR